MKDVGWVGNLNEFNYLNIDLTVEDVLDECFSLELQDGRIGADSGEIDNIRNTKVGFIHNEESKTYRAMSKIGTAINNTSFGFDISGIESIQYSEYNANEEGKYDWHIDTNFTSEGYIQRKLSIIVQLTDEDEYEGGELDIEMDMYGADWGAYKPHIKKKGTIIIFPSFLKHRITPVTKGVRKSLITWVIGAKFK